MDFTEQVVAVTGGASGIGLETATELLKHGASVALIDLNKESLDRAADGLDGRVMTFRADVTDAGEVNAAVQELVEQFGKLDGLVACAGVRMRKYLPVVELVSGAGHDAAVLRAAGVAAGMLFVRSLNGGISHSPDELSSPEDIALAVDVLSGALTRLSAATD